MKLKARPWFDIFAQMETLATVVPPHVKLDLDFNGLLVNPGNAVPVLKELEDFPNVSLFETPIPQADMVGSHRVRQSVSRPIAMHYGTPPIETALREDICDGFVVGGDLSAVLDAGAVLAAHNKPFWLQLTGTGITAAFALHLGAVLTHAQWPAITCHENYAEDLLCDPIEIGRGHARVPEGPGLGVEVDEDALERYWVQPDFQYEVPQEVYCISWPDGSSVYYADAVAYRRDFLAGLLPIALRGVEHTALKDDGSQEFAELREQALANPIWSTHPLD
jgi:L-alanine-DL-glutamate epimerase-like enolase superfamily enzyme